MDLILLQSFLLWCSLINISILLIWFAMFVVAHEFIYNLHSRWFKISYEKFDSIHYSAMAFWKLSVFLFNLVPYIVLGIIS
ncbi:MAG: hypothetical protein M0Q24_05850 [Sulfurimonas sp.]|uniref:DUF6868 family protein n=1 Tax=Sulfurimonas sp. TaxID=2022749 RepID=UPI0025FB7545|nr:hypothetical protein [Sulfurimonas sp.]MCK9491593.1 hypothetical protein [Sulfurimonas sp.]